ncbi:AGE family epimerase/isomerase [Brachybacterium sp. UMB0905]|uniref:AGE family epimerase/isomerase n=1 Tax=Brachybacterium sp. UMB0905 TaxID=2069310 RepID=UPI000C802018|nr:AGE family epimerase/isomerase [Brachybacterium sp. UMB0905]PMC74759.1 N-acylglucosamine 2-epimerase [Brachybacterium sp. UMB0905]
MRDSLRTHLERDVLAWWSRHGADDELGGVRTCFTNRGQLRTTEKYTWSQGRWAWTSALVAEELDAGRLEGDRDLWRRRALRTADFLAEHAFLPDGRTAFLLSARGEPVADAQGELATSVFADLFAVLGLAGALRLTEPSTDGDREHGTGTPAATRGPAAGWLAQAERTLHGAADSLRRRTARSEPYPVPRGFGDLAGPMTLLHVAAELHRATGSDLAAEVMSEARAVLLGGDDAFLGTEVWWEHRPDAAADHDTLLARHVTPGHLLELLWMLVHVGDQHPQLAVAESTLTVLALRALETGWDQAEGGLLRYVDRGTGAAPAGRELGTPYEALVHRTWDTKLWWVHAETLYATALLARRTGSPEIARWAEQVREYTMATFPDPDGQEWIQIRSRDGSPLDEVVALPVKDPMHIARSLLLLNALEAGGES